MKEVWQGYCDAMNLNESEFIRKAVYNDKGLKAWTKIASQTKKDLQEVDDALSGKANRW